MEAIRLQNPISKVLGILKQMPFNDDFSELPSDVMGVIAGPMPDRTKIEEAIEPWDSDTYEYTDDAYAKWLARGRARWRLMQADALVDEIDNIKY